jgi:protein gp37
LGKSTGIAWTDHTFNPWWGCAHVSPGCVYCYAETFAQRVGHDVWGAKGERRLFGEKHWAEPLRWDAHAEAAGVRERVFCASMADVFEDHPALPPERDKLWELIAATPALDWQILTKRPENIPAMLPALWGDGWPNVWLGVSVEDQQRADERVPKLLSVPAAVHFLSCEPLIGPVDLWDYSPAMTEDRPDEEVPGVDWVIVGGESGPQHRQMDPRWLSAIANVCDRTGISLFTKQDSGLRPGHQGRLSGALWGRKEFPQVVMIDA